MSKPIFCQDPSTPTLTQRHPRYRLMFAVARFTDNLPLHIQQRANPALRILNDVGAGRRAFHDMQMRHERSSKARMMTVEDMWFLTEDGARLALNKGERLDLEDFPGSLKSKAAAE